MTAIQQDAARWMKSPSDAQVIKSRFEDVLGSEFKDNVLSAESTNIEQTQQQQAFGKLSAHLQELFEKCQEKENDSLLGLPDFIIEAMNEGGVDTKIEFRVHSRLLAHRWPWFRKIMTSGFKESSIGMLYTNYYRVA